MPTIDEQKAAVVALLENGITQKPAASTLSLWELYLAIAGSSAGGGGVDATDASLQEILAKLPDYSTPRTTTAATHNATSGTVAAGAKVAYFDCRSGTATLFGGGLTLDATDATGPSTFNLEYAGEGGHGAIAWTCTGTLIISETR